jgi:hypothetical protein
MFMGPAEDNGFYQAYVMALDEREEVSALAGPSDAVMV